MEEPARRSRRRGTRREQTAVEYAIGVLAARSLPEHRLRQRLEARYQESDVDAALARLRELGLVDDDAWAERFARDRFERLGKGRHRIRAELVARGIDGRVADVALGRVIDSETERRHAAAALEALRRSLARGSGGAAAAVGRGESASCGARGPDSGGRRASGNLQQRLFRRMLVRGYPAAVVRDLLGVS